MRVDRGPGLADAVGSLDDIGHVGSGAGEGVSEEILAGDVCLAEVETGLGGGVGLVGIEVEGVFQEVRQAVAGRVGGRAREPVASVVPKCWASHEDMPGAAVMDALVSAQVAILPSSAVSRTA